MKEEEIRPEKIFKQYLELAEKDVKEYFSGCRYEKRICPACGKDGKPEFRKKGFEYWLCQNCLTLYVNPLPEKRAFEKYYKEAPSTKFWATDFYKHTEEARREKIVVPRVEKIKNIIEKYNGKIRKIVDIGGGYGTFAEEFEKSKEYESCAIEPNKDLAENIREKNIPVIVKFVEELEKNELPEGDKCFTSFELVEHLHDPKKFFSKIYELMDKEDILVFTTLSAMGLDILVLWEESKSVFPPHHVNFFNTESIKKLLENIGFEVLEVTTPGKLDVDILKNNSEKVKDRFWKYFLKTSKEEKMEKMQSFISENNLSSHMMCIARKGR